jgi:YegS/Rv2252/BmrU family lipid kinase
MKKISLIYNPNSGDKAFKYELDNCLSWFNAHDCEVNIFRTNKYGDIQRHVAAIKDENYDAICISGGDGTINILVNAMMENGLSHIPIGLFPSGTANDFASFMNIPSDTERCCRIITNGKTMPVDLGMANDKYFVNVCAGGLFSNVSADINKYFKDAFGKLAYYLKGIEQLGGFKPIPMRITSSNGTIEDNINLFLVLNSSGTGGIGNLVQRASVNDGKLDFLGFRNDLFKDTPRILLSFLKGEYLDDEGVIYFQDNDIKIENLDPDNRFSVTDCDGEVGPTMPLEIKNVHNAIKIFIE